MLDRDQTARVRQRNAVPAATPSPSRADDGGVPWAAAAAAAVFALGFLAYANTLGHGFVWDDWFLLEQKVRFYRGPLDAWAEPAGLPNMRMYRPLEMMSLWLDQQLWWRNAFGFHLTSALLHATNAVLVLLLARALGAGFWAALVAAALFAVHPVQVESVAWVTCRADVLTATFAVLATLAFLRFRTRPRWMSVAAIAACAFLAAASKETGSVVPFLLLAATLTLTRYGSRPALRFGDRTWLGLAAAGVGVAACLALRPAEVTTGVDPATFGARDLLHLVGSFGYQIERVLAPIGFQPYVPETPTGLVHVGLALLGLVGGALLLFTSPNDGGMRRFATLWFLVAIAPAVSVVLADFSTTPVAERRVYLAMVGVALLVASALTRYSRVLASRGGAFAVSAILTLLVIVTVTRNRYWRNDLTLWSAVTERDHVHALPSMNLGLALADAGRAAEAERAYRHALEATGNAVTRQRTDINLGLLLLEQGKVDEAADFFTHALQISPHAIAHRGLAIVARRRGQAAALAGDAATAARLRREGEQHLEIALAINPRYYPAHFTLAGLRYDGGDYPGALAHYRRVIELAADTDIARAAAGAAEELSAWLAAHPAER